MSRRRAAFRLRRKFGRSNRARMDRSVVSMMYRGKTIFIRWMNPGYETEVLGERTIYSASDRDAAIAKAKRVIDAMKGD